MRRPNARARTPSHSSRAFSSTPFALGLAYSKALGFGEPDAQTLKNAGTLIRKYGAEWSIGITDVADVAVKVEELVWLVTLLYGVGGLKPGKSFRADFVTYALSVPS